MIVPRCCGATMVTDHAERVARCEACGRFLIWGSLALDQPAVVDVDRAAHPALFDHPLIALDRDLRRLAS